MTGPIAGDTNPDPVGGGDPLLLGDVKSNADASGPESLGDDIRRERSAAWVWTLDRRRFENSPLLLGPLTLLVSAISVCASSSSTLVSQLGRLESPENHTGGMLVMNGDKIGDMRLDPSSASISEIVVEGDGNWLIGNVGLFGENIPVERSTGEVNGNADGELEVLNACCCFGWIHCGPFCDEADEEKD